MDSFPNSDGHKLVCQLVEVIQSNKAYLSEIDGAIGDGDHGINMSKGFSMAGERIGDKKVSLSEGLLIIGKTLLMEIGGAMGPLYGSIFKSMGKACRDSETIDKETFAEMLKAALDSVDKLGKARPGDKTLIDTLDPAVDDFVAAIEAKKSFSESLDSMKAAAQKGRDSTRDLVAKKGRASRLGERSRGHLDAGATSCCLILCTLADGSQALMRESPKCALRMEDQATNPTLDSRKPPLWGDQGNGTYRNPILWADFNNPEVLRDGDDYYLISATHHFMGMQVLHSRDLVNWRFISRVYERMDFDPRYDAPGLAYQHGSWAPCMVKHDGRFYIYFITVREGIFMTVADHPSGPWAPLHHVHREVEWEDPYPFWDDDGTAWLFHGGKRSYPLRLHQMSSDGKQLLDDGFMVLEDPALKGPRVFKRHGWYYIFVAEAGMHKGRQVIYRSRSLKGPYEKRVLLHQGSSPITGPRQGPLIEVGDGRLAFIHQVVQTGYGRLTYLQPAEWGDDDWPRIGVGASADQPGEPVLSGSKPLSGQVCLPAMSDEFDTPELGLQWMWNHNPVLDAWSLTERPGWMRLYACTLQTESGMSGADGGRPVPAREDSLLFAWNILAQRPFGEDASATTLLDVNGMVEGQRAGLALFSIDYLWIGVVRENGRTFIRAATDDAVRDGVDLLPNVTKIHLRVQLSPGCRGSVSWSLDGETFYQLGPIVSHRFAWFEGVKYALFTYNVQADEGYADFDYIRCRHDGPVEQ